MRRRVLLVVGCGDIGMRVLRLAHPRWRVLALTSQPARMAELRAFGAQPLLGDLDRPETLWRLGSLADAVLHLAPPPATGEHDPRTRALLAALAHGGRTGTLVYASTTGVYGDAGGERFDETRAVAPASARARRRVDAERRVRWYGRACGARVTILRIPGIYGGGRGQPRERLVRGMPVLARDEDVYTNHIHADDLARACMAALDRGRAQRVVHVCDATELKMGDYFDLAADLLGLPRPPRVTRAQARELLPASQMSFMDESRRLTNGRLVRELRLELRYPSVREGLRAP